MLLLLDLHALIHRAYWAIPRLTDSSGQPTNAVYGLTNMIFRLVDDLTPSHLLAANDLPEPSFRHQEYIGYQIKRQRAEEDLVSQIPLAHHLVKSMQIPLFSSSGFEADDVIATLVKKLLPQFKKTSSQKSSPVLVTIVTGDKDLMQLVSRQVHLHLPLRGLSQTQDFGPRAVREKLGVKPSQVVDYKALVGDSSDNYPGVLGIGEKTAVPLLQKYGSLDQIYQNLSDISSPALREKLKSSKEDAYLSRRLAKLVDTVPLPAHLRLSSLKFKPSQLTQSLPFLQELGFHSLQKRLEKYEKKEKIKEASHHQTSLF